MKSIKGINVKSKRVLLRVDFNVPVLSGKILDNTKIQAHVPTLDYLKKYGAKTILISHFGKPKGKKVKGLSLKPVAKELEKILERKVIFIPEVWGKKVEDQISKLKDGEICVLENLRYDKGEEMNDPVFTERLARLGDIFVQDAFAECHKAAASMVGIPKILPAYAGFLLEKEIENLTKYLLKPKKPFICIIGGAKISTKIDILKSLIGKADVLAIGGGMANNFLAVEGFEVGKSMVEEDYFDEADSILSDAHYKETEIILPEDVYTAKKLDSRNKPELKEINQVSTNDIIVDIGPKTVGKFVQPIEFAGTVFWNGPLGVTEVENFSKSTKAIAEIVLKSKAVSIVGGGDTIAVLEKFKLTGKFTYVSTGGGATMEFIEKEGKLPGIMALG
ncbi:MAG: phosphoglycerate kinase [Patescibacteria group bacterium]|nr:phosphoglycerate kinase [Patescibacteria group bacterium]